ncbi:hypothetical protein BGZ82_006502 [Podila clonocystis]|nr:hypothetical protein BGZ82_006502 [Podila clonocystis]
MSVPMGVVDNTVDNVHRFFRMVDGRYWKQIESFYKYRDPVKTPHQHYELYYASLGAIKNSTLVDTKLKMNAGKLLERLLYEEFITMFTGLLGKHEEKSAQSSVRGLYLGVASALSAKSTVSKGNQGASSSSQTKSSTALSSTSTSTSSDKNVTRKRKPPTKDSSRKSSKSDFLATKRIKEPWHSLIEVALLRYDGWNEDLPDMDAIAPTDESLERRNLYKIALHHLHGAVEQQARPNFDRAHCLDYKDAFVALSGVWNTFSASANNMFGQSATREVKVLCYKDDMDERDSDLEKLCKVLLEVKTLDQMLNALYILIKDLPSYRGIFQALETLITNIIRPLHGSRAPSEAECLFLWTSLFQRGLPLDSLMCMHLGEQGCAAFALSKSKLADVFETNTSPRKCDGLMTVGRIEVGNLECKRVGASKTEVACQLRKNIKINKSILLQLEEYGLECPLLLSIHGTSAIVFRVRKWKDIWVAGKGANTIVLPTTEDEIRLFLEDTVHNLANLIDHYDDYATDAHRKYQQYQYRKKSEVEEEVASSIPKSVSETLEWEQVVLHTPTKSVKKASKQPRPLLEKLKQVQDETEPFSSDEDDKD